MSATEELRMESTCAFWKGSDIAGIHQKKQKHQKITIEVIAAKLTTANNALRSGKISRHPCAICGGEPAHKHHDDYSKPLDVIWLCPKHHKQMHLSKRNP
jgi:hypothetical protein